jgi:hypothetical protein
MKRDTAHVHHVDADVLSQPLDVAVDDRNHHYKVQPPELPPLPLMGLGLSVVSQPFGGKSPRSSARVPRITVPRGQRTGRLPGHG